MFFFIRISVEINGSMKCSLANVNFTFHGTEGHALFSSQRIVCRNSGSDPKTVGFVSLNNILYIFD